tara:strand:+ start:415 stop:672 length:258 start_codon:yes stop_codon:yes gene_type:complete
MNILIAQDNPDGAKLEELLADVVEDLKLKNERIVHDTCPVSIRIQANNSDIIKMLETCITLQNQSLAALDAIGLDNGPTGKPRIG